MKQDAFPEYGSRDYFIRLPFILVGVALGIVRYVFLLNLGSRKAWANILTLKLLFLAWWLFRSDAWVSVSLIGAGAGFRFYLLIETDEVKIDDRLHFYPAFLIAIISFGVEILYFIILKIFNLL